MHQAYRGLAALQLSSALLLIPLFLLPSMQPTELFSTAAGTVQLEAIAPGTRIGTTAPVGWSHLILKSQPRLDDNEIRKVGTLKARYAVMYFTTVAAKVGRSRHGYRLTKLGFSIGANVRGEDMAVSPDTALRLGVDLGLFGGPLLGRMHEKLAEVRIVGSTPNGVYVDTPAFMARGDRHVAVTLRYWHHVDPATGQLSTFAWRIDHRPDGGYEPSVTGPAQWIAIGEQIDVTMQVDLREMVFGIPNDQTFAIRRFSAERHPVAFPAEFAALAALPEIDPSAALRIETFLLAHIP